MNDAPKMADPTAVAADALLAAYTRAVLGFRLGGADDAARAAPGCAPSGQAAPNRADPDQTAPDQTAVTQAVEKALRLAARSGRPHLVLLGTGDGQLPDALADALASAIAANAASPRLTLCDLSPDNVRAALAAGRLTAFTPPALPDATTPRLLADTSPWALLLLLRATGIAPESATLFPNPFLPPAEAEVLRRWRRLFGACAPVDLPPVTPPSAPDLGVGAILHPQEPDLAGFFAQIPAWVREVAVVWDGAPPGFDAAALCPVPLRQTVRPLGGDFAAQRNAMLGLLSTGWCLYLDADERLSARTWALLPRLMAVPGAGAWVFPRATAYPDANHLRVGYGLWPDVQLRLFRRTEGVCFTGAVHERVVGVNGHTCLLADAWIDHLSWTAKDRETLAERLRVFDAAAQAGGMDHDAACRAHRLSAEYPALRRDLFAAAGLAPGAPEPGRPTTDDGQRSPLALRLPLSP
ncbi:hypothetical protein RVX_R23120 [Nitratidesulfovibrio sp. HK-II]|uniref:hypothetical protein n=1 Tax=Nitratidesulfovibrio sp. HK-II TaxID=2009266 RepID=UPI000E2FE211|nr:hypothetical protein [Nitratidesulfovibrio sp. HK-II]GBO96683.1 hypothetical protein RVX_1722 [Nitratidesulfovibrio sp. HK-II]